MALLSVALTDELWSGVAVVSAPEIERVHEVDHSGYTLTVFVVPIVLSAVFEASMSLLSHVIARRKVLRAALCLLAVALCGCALATNPGVLALGLSVAGAASGVACGVSEATLVVRHPTELDRTMARWMVAGGIGDVLAPSLVALVLFLGGSYRTGFLLVLVWIGLQGLSHAKVLSDTPMGDDDEGSGSVWLAVRESIGNRRLWLWLSGTALCTLLDELVAALSALRLSKELGASPPAASASLIGYSCGVVVGALCTERLVTRLGYRRILVVSAVLCALALSSTIAATNVPWMMVSLTILGLTAAAHYPLLLARAYEAAPGRSAVVGAMAEVFVIFDLLLPWLLGSIADEYGLQLALGCLAAQPLGVMMLALGVRSKEPSGTRDDDEV